MSRMEMIRCHMSVLKSCLTEGVLVLGKGRGSCVMTAAGDLELTCFAPSEANIKYAGLHHEKRCNTS